jgi:hypothetical protein
MPESRPSIKLDFTSGLEALPPRPKMDAATTIASVAAGRDIGFSDRTDSPAIDGRRLRSRGANIQLNLKVTAEEKNAILRDATRFIQDPASPISNIGEFVVYAVNFLRTHGPSNT